MKAVLILCFAVLAVVSAQGNVHVVDHPNQVNVVDQPNQVHVVDQPGQIVIQNPDSAFYRPTQTQTGGEPVSIGPAFVEGQGRPPYPYKNYNNPLARGGK